MRKLVSGLVPIVVVACLLTVVGVSPAAAHAPKKKARGVLEVVCVDRGDQSLRVPAAGCARGEDRVRVSVAERLRVRRGLLVPNNEGAWFCAAPRGGALREIDRPGQCRKGRALESRNHRPGPPELSDTEVPENVPVGTAVGALTAADKDAADRMTYRLVGGDTDVFQIAGGALVTAAPLDFETRTGYRVRVQVTDLLGLSRAATYDVAVVDAQENRPPTDVSLDGSAIDENLPAGSLVGHLGATDPDTADEHTYTLVTAAGVGNDNPLFSVAGDELRTVAPFDFEERAQLTIRVRADDGAGGSFEKDLAVAVTDAPDAPTAVGLAPGTIRENTTGEVGALSATDQDENEQHTFSLVAGEGDRDNGRFAISGDRLSLVSPADFESRSALTARVRVTDKDGRTYDQAVSVSVTNAAEAPTGLSLSPASVPENEPAGTRVGTLAISDPDGSDAGRFELVSGTGGDDNAAFRIEGNALVTDETFDYEADASRTVRVRGSDVSGMSVESALTVSVVNRNEAATRLDLSNSTVDEDAEIGAVVGTLSTDDPDLDDPITYTLTEDVDGVFAVEGDELVTAGDLDREVATSHTVEVRAEDAGGETVDATFVISVVNINEAPSAPSINDDTVDENLAPGAEVGQLTATDPDGGDTLAYALVAGEGDDDNAAFELTGTTLTTAARFDFEAKATYSIRVRVTDSGTPSLSTDAVLTIHVADVNEAPAAPSLDPSSIAENKAPGALVGSLSAIDPDTGDTLSYTLLDDLDSDHFQVTGAGVYALDAFDFEDQDSYEIRVEVSDGHGESADATLTITVTDANDAPSDLSLSNDELDENTPSDAIGTLSTTDEDAGDSHTYTLPEDEADNDEFLVVGDELRAAGPFDHETQPTLDVLVRSTDEAGASYERTFTITVDDVNEAPTAISLSDDEVDENVATQDVGTLSAADPEGGSMTYALVNGAGDHDNGSFEINGTTLRATAAFDFETEPTLTVRVRVTDAGGLSHVQALTVDVVDVDDLPTGLIFRSGGSVAENLAAGTEVGWLDIVDVDGQDTVEYSIVDGAGKFAVSAAGEMTTTGALDFETTPDVTVRVAVSDGAVTTYTGDVVVTVTNRNESPSRVDLSSTSVDENEPAGTVVGTLSAVDPDVESEDPTFELVQGGAQFEIDGDELVTKAAFDHEATASYTIRVRATDAGDESVETPITVTVGQVNEAPSVTAPTGLSVDENRPAGTAVGTITATDPESDALTWSLASGAGSADNAKFAISSAGELTTAAGLDFEAQDTMHVRVRVSDGTLTDERELTVTVLDVNDPPTVVADSYTGVVGNTFAQLGSVSNEGPTVVLAGTVPLANDHDQDGDPISVVAASSRPTALNGHVTIYADGSFVYLPPVGVKDRTDTFEYTVTDGESQSTGTLSLVIADRLVWYLGDNGSGVQNGTALWPLVTLSSLNRANDLDGPGDELYLFGGGYADRINLGTFTLEKDQKLIGAGVALPGILPAGSTPTTSARLTLADGTSIDGVVLTASSSDDTSTVTANGVDSFTIGSSTTVRNIGVAAPVSIVGGAGDISVGAAIEATGGGPVRVNNRTAGTVTFTGPISTVSTAARAISVTGNTGATVRFSGGLTLSTGSNPAFSVSGGGTVEVTGAGNTITTTSGTPLRVSDTVIGAAGLTFRSISSSGAANGIVLQNTGTSGSLTVTGNSSGACGGTLTTQGAPNANPTTSDCTGGTISASTGAGISLENTKAPSFTRIHVTGSADDGVSARSVSGLTIVNSYISSNGDAIGENGVDLGGSEATSYAGVTGTVSITDTTIGGSGDTNLFSGTSSGTTTLSLLRNRVFGRTPGTGLGAKDGIRVEAASGGTVDLTVTGSFLTANEGDQLQVVARGSGKIQNAAITRNSTWAGNRGVQVAAGGTPFTGALAFDIANNAIRGITGPAIAVIGTNVNGTGYVGHVRSNLVGSSSAAASCATAGDGILVSTEDGTGSLTVDVSDNLVNQCVGRGIVVEATGGAAAVNAAVLNNRVYLDSSSVSEALRLDLNPQPTDTGTSCVQIATNTLSPGTSPANGVSFRLDHGYGTLQAVTTAIGNLGDTYEARLAHTNTITGGVLAYRPAGSTHTGVASCPTAPN
ncbi:cadherin domain-containing protein [Nocardioides sp. SR21]|uniref:cadherin domain-containing protein n=1 Tax=Nocardioides sp. SR21 TaxID=2919501 RepID=UPI001FAA6C6B|nr:cadherin domain-containing protein [Nocardioides sp. SR21]